MRVNLPVTNIEYELKEGASIVSKTDLKGRITYVNPAFVEASGYSEDELLGEAHNLIRHPDMPAEVFADLWITLSERLPWTGMVKNRRKNGDYYWVLANVTPLRKKPPTIGYMSVRNKPTRQQIEEAEHVYRLFKEGRAGGMKMLHGAVVRGGLIGKLNAIRRIPINLRIMLTAVCGAALMAALGILGWWETTALAKIAGVQSWVPAVLAISGCIGGLLLALFGYFISSTILKPLDRALEIAHAIAWGDLSLRFEMSESDETGQLMPALNQMKANLVAVISDVDSQVNSISAAAKEIANLSSQIRSPQGGQRVVPAADVTVQGRQISDQMSETTPHNAAAEVQIMTAALALQRQVVKLEQVVSVFKLGDA
ncbi:MAG: PAS domain-containing protein [Sulfuriferula sp.]